MKRGGGRRYYRPDDVDLLRGIRTLLYADGLTIRGVQRILKEKGGGFVAGAGRNGPPNATEVFDFDTAATVAEVGAAGNHGVADARIGGEARVRLETVLAELADAKRLLDEAR